MFSSHLFQRKNLPLFIIILLAFSLRFYQFHEIPQGFHADEASFGYNAYSLLLTGKDEYGNIFPLSLKSFGDYKGAVYAYLAIPFIAVLGLTETAVRLPSVLFGTLLVLLVYLIVNLLTNDKRLSLIAATLSAISPFSIFFSRMQNDPLVAVSFVLLGFYLFLLWLVKGKDIFMSAAGAMWILSYFTYASPRIFLPVLIFLLIGFYGNQIRKKGLKLFSLVILVVFIINTFLFIGNTQERFQQLTVFNTPSVTLPLAEQIREDGHSSALTARIFHNKLVNYGLFFTESYFSYFSFNFLFIQGGMPAREIIPGIGFLYLVEFPFLLFGIYKIIEQRKRWGIFMGLWILAVPALMAFAVDESPNVHRFLLGILPLHLIIAFGILQFYMIAKKRRKLRLFLLFFIPLLFVGNVLYFLHQLFVHQPVHQPWHRGFAYKELVREVSVQYPKYKKIVVTKSHSSPYIYFLFYNRYDPSKYQKEGSPRDLDYTGFDKYIFEPLECPITKDTIEEDVKKGKDKVLFINKGSCVVKKNNTKLIKTIYWKDNSPAFTLMEFIATESAILNTNEEE